MKVYLLMQPDYEGDHFYGAFSSKEKAMNSLAYHNQRFSEENIVEEELDPPDEGPRFETIKTCFVYSDGKIERSDYWGHYDDPTLDKFSIHSGHGVEKANVVYGWGGGRTDEEAEANARLGLAMLNPVWAVTDTSTGALFERDFLAPECVPWSNSYAVHRDLNVARTEWAAFKQTGKNEHGIIVEAKP